MQYGKYTNCFEARMHFHSTNIACVSQTKIIVDAGKCEDANNKQDKPKNS